VLECAFREGGGDEGKNMNRALEEIAKRLECQVVAIGGVMAHLLKVGSDGDGLSGGAVLTAGPGLGV